MCQQAKFRVVCLNRCGDMAVFRCFKMAAVRHLGFVLHVFGPPTKSICWHDHCAKFSWNRCSIVDNMPVLMICKFGLKMPIHAPFGCFFGGFDPRWKTISTNPRRLNLRIYESTNSGSSGVLIVLVSIVVHEELWRRRWRRRTSIFGRFWCFSKITPTWPFAIFLMSMCSF